MTILARAVSIAVASITVASFDLLTGHALAQPAKLGCTSAPTAQGTQTLHCPTAITIVAESGAKFELRDRNRDGHVDSVELSNKALLLEVPKKPGRARFDVVTPQAIAQRHRSSSSTAASAWRGPPAAAASYSAPVTASMSSHRAT
jgi:hypothetical protein